MTTTILWPLSLSQLRAWNACYGGRAAFTLAFPDGLMPRTCDALERFLATNKDNAEVFNYIDWLLVNVDEDWRSKIEPQNFNSESSTQFWRRAATAILGLVPEPVAEIVGHLQAFADSRDDIELVDVGKLNALLRDARAELDRVRFQRDELAQRLDAMPKIWEADGLGNGLVFETQEDALDKLIDQHGRERDDGLRCESCSDERFYDESEFNEHMRSQHAATSVEYWECMLCSHDSEDGDKWWDEEEFRTHMARRHVHEKIAAA